METKEIRRSFLEYFAHKDHEIVASGSLVPHDDPTLLFTNAGMVQFKDVFLGTEKRPYSRATTSQRCVRAGGKHNDLDNVGYTARHHTFFEMLGNFSFGDYFKREAIHHAWELLTQGYGLPTEKLWVTVFEEDDEAADIWTRDIGVPEDRVARIGAHDNFWSMGDTGPCGPCSEIFYDHGPDVEGGPPGTPDEDGDRYIEIWNLVFMQFNRSGDGSMEPLPKPSVDTGMGLERLAAVLQGVHSNYEIDLFQRLITAAAETLEITDLSDKSLRVVADHIRSTSFLITDGVTPSNEGRGYVLRRIIRRAIRHGYQAGGNPRFMHRLVEPLVQEMGDAFPELRDAQTHVESVLAQESDRFAETLDQGMGILEAEIAGLDSTTIPGEVVFRLYDTYGFPADLTADVAREQGLQIDQSGFESAMEAQRTRARSASRFVAQDKINLDIDADTEFCGYTQTALSATVLAIAVDGQSVESIAAGEEGVVVLAQTPFYPEGGGQVGDQGQLEMTGQRFTVVDTRRISANVIGHFGHQVAGELRVGDTLEAAIDTNLRQSTRYNHSATHLLHAALRQVLGDHVQQKGSLVAADRLRFDFSHGGAVSAAEMAQIETLVNNNIRANHDVSVEKMALEKARESGAAALFGEKYDDEVRVVGMGEFSLELCGGTHVQRTGDIGLFKIVNETGTAAGVRRIEALTGAAAMDWLSSRSATLDRIASAVRGGQEDIEERVSQIVQKNRDLEKALEKARSSVDSGASGIDQTMDSARDVDGIRVLVLRRDDIDPKLMRSMMDQLKNKLGSGLVVIGGVRNDKASILAGVTKDLSKGVHAGSLVKDLAAKLDGRGGGKAEMGQGGGPRAEELDAVLDCVPAWVEANRITS